MGWPRRVERLSLLSLVRPPADSVTFGVVLTGCAPQAASVVASMQEFPSYNVRRERRSRGPSCPPTPQPPRSQVPIALFGLYVSQTRAHRYVLFFLLTIAITLVTDMLWYFFNHTAPSFSRWCDTASCPGP